MPSLNDAGAAYAQCVEHDESDCLACRDDAWCQERWRLAYTADMLMQAALDELRHVDQGKRISSRDIGRVAAARWLS